MVRIGLGFGQPQMVRNVPDPMDSFDTNINNLSYMVWSCSLILYILSWRIHLSHSSFLFHQSVHSCLMTLPEMMASAEVWVLQTACGRILMIEVFLEISFIYQVWLNYHPNTSWRSRFLSSSWLSPRSCCCWNNNMKDIWLLMDH